MKNSNLRLLDLKSTSIKYDNQKINIGEGVFPIATALFIIGIRLINQNIFRKWKTILFMISCPLFSIVIMPPGLRLLGV